MSKQTIEVTFTEHCDNDDCDLGYADYFCPSCKRLVIDYEDLWWKRYDLDDGDKIESKCDHCHSTHTLTKTSESNKFYIEETCQDIFQRVP